MDIILIIGSGVLIANGSFWVARRFYKPHVVLFCDWYIKKITGRKPHVVAEESREKFISTNLFATSMLLANILVHLGFYFIIPGEILKFIPLHLGLFLSLFLIYFILSAFLDLAAEVSAAKANISKK